jgi:hypothetical protein
MPHQKGPITSTFTADWFLGTGTRATRRMDEKDRGQITGPKENAAVELPYVPDKLVDT